MLSRGAGLTYYELVAEIFLQPDLFTTENGLVSETGRLRRPTLVQYFAPQIDMMYKRLNATKNVSSKLLKVA